MSDGEDGLDHGSSAIEADKSKSGGSVTPDQETSSTVSIAPSTATIKGGSGSGILEQEHNPNVKVEEAEDTPPALPPRPANLDLLDERKSGTLKLPRRASRPQLQARPTTALSIADVQIRNHHENSLSRSTSRTVSRKPSNVHLSRVTSRAGSDGDDCNSLRSYAPSVDYGGQAESILGGFLAEQATPAWKALSAQLEHENPFEQQTFVEDEIYSARLHHEFDQLEEMRPDGSNEELLLNDWKAKLKHFIILSSSGKPIWSRHGDDQLISSYVGLVQTIISFYQGAKDPLKGFTAGEARFVILSKGHLNLVAISKMGESDGQLRTQLDSLYMQILSTLTLPSMERMFSNRPSTDLRRPLQGTEVLLDALADGFTRGSPSTLLSALECLKLRKTQRQVINNSMLKVRSPSLLYGLLVAGGRLVSVMRPKKHSLHPGDLQLIFNMLFEAGSVKAGGGENWIPLCLPGFNNTGFLYMYVSFLNASKDQSSMPERPNTSTGRDDEIALVFISANKEGFFELRQMRDDLVEVGLSNHIPRISTCD